MYAEALLIIPNYPLKQYKSSKQQKNATVIVEFQKTNFFLLPDRTALRTRPRLPRNLFLFVRPLGRLPPPEPQDEPHEREKVGNGHM